MSTVILKPFFPEAWADDYARRFYKTDPEIVEIYLIPPELGQRDVRLLIVNRALVERNSDVDEPLIMTSDRGGPDEHRVIFLDVTPTQWTRIQGGQISLPDGWSLKDKKLMPRN